VDQTQIKLTVKAYVLNEFLPGEPADSLTNDTALISDGIIDSLGALRLVSFLEETFKVNFAPHEMNADYLDTIDRIAEVLAGKISVAA
jgi:acyl carrier protein